MIAVAPKSTVRSISAGTAARAAAARGTTVSAEPAPGWARHHPQEALAFLYVSPHPCAALDELMGL